MLVKRMSNKYHVVFVINYTFFTNTNFYNKIIEIAGKKLFSRHRNRI